MKRLILFIAIFLFLFSCEEGLLVTEDELPVWLLDKIEVDEQIISEYPKYYLASGAWVRVEWDKVFYYEYRNSLSSVFPKPISHYGDTLDFHVNNSKTDYSKEKCCHEYVWIGPTFPRWLYKD